QQQQQQHQRSNSEDEEEQDHHRGRGNTLEKRETAYEQGGSDFWANSGNAGLSDWSSSEPGESQMIFMDRDDTSNQGQPPRSSEQYHHKVPARHSNDDDGHFPSTGSSQGRRPMTSEERFNNSYNRPPGGGGGSKGGGSNGRYNSRSGPGSRYGDGSSGAGSGGHGYERVQRHGPMTVTPSSPVGPTGRRYFNSTMDRDSALDAWSVASKYASSKPGSSQGVPPSGSSVSLPGSTATEGSPRVKSPGRTTGGGGRLALATVSDFSSFFQAAATFTPPPVRAKVRQGSHMRRGSESESTTTRHSSPSRSRGSSRSRPPYSGTDLRHKEEEPEDTKENIERESLSPGPEYVEEDKDLIKDEEIAPVVVTGDDAVTGDDSVTGDDAGTGVEEEDTGDKRLETVEDDRKAVERMNSNSSRTSSQAMEDNLLNFQMQKQAAVSGSGLNEKEEDKDMTMEECGDAIGAVDAEKVAVCSTQGSPKADSDDV
ncbi:hypothetical protein BGZ47_001424, partial [Haplosporangium gracile]